MPAHSHTPGPIVIVDGYSTGAKLASAFAGYGIRCVHVQSLLEPIEYNLPSYRPKDFDAHVVHDGNVATTAAALAQYSPSHVVPGCECGVTLADALAEALAVPTRNELALSPTRRNKVRMAERARACGLAAPPTFEVSTPDEAVAAAVSIGEWPVVVKPVDSGGSDGLHFCNDAEAVRAAAASQLGRLNVLRLFNRTVLVQKRLTGQQYIIQAVSREGRHFISEIWRDDRRRGPGAGVINDREVLLESQGEVQTVLRDYVSACLDACGVRTGPSFLEVMMTSTGPVVIDFAARMMGAQDDEAMVRAVGQSQVTLTAACYGDPAGFDRMTAEPYHLRQHAAVVSLMNGRLGRVRNTVWLERIRALPTFHSIIRAPEIGDVLRPTIDITTTYGIVYLIGDRTEDIERDYRAIRELESSGLIFDLEPLDVSA